MTGPDRRLHDSWRANAARWTEAIRSGAIASRQLATDAAMLDTLRDHNPRTLLDLGCGEGWLARAAASMGVTVVGTDASPELIQAARLGGGGTFLLVSYDDIVADPTRVGRDFAMIAANFALLDDRAGTVLAALRRVLAPGGVVAIQTLHPLAAGPPYEDGWREETFSGFGASASWQPMPWYFRTVASWLALVHSAGFRLVSLREPIHPETKLPLSLLMVCQPA